MYVNHNQLNLPAEVNRVTELGFNGRAPNLDYASFGLPQEWSGVLVALASEIAKQSSEATSFNNLRVFAYNLLAQNGYNNKNFYAVLSTVLNDFMNYPNKNMPGAIAGIVDNCLVVWTATLVMAYPSLANVIDRDIYQQSIQIANNGPGQAQQMPMMAPRQNMYGPGNMAHRDMPRHGSSMMSNNVPDRYGNRAPTPSAMPFVDARVSHNSARVNQQPGRFEENIVNREQHRTVLKPEDFQVNNRGQVPHVANTAPAQPVAPMGFEPVIQRNNQTKSLLVNIVKSEESPVPFTSMLGIIDDIKGLYAEELIDKHYDLNGVYYEGFVSQKYLTDKPMSDNIVTYFTNYIRDGVQFSLSFGDCYASMLNKFCKEMTVLCNKHLFESGLTDVTIDDFMIDYFKLRAHLLGAEHTEIIYVGLVTKLISLLEDNFVKIEIEEEIDSEPENEENLPEGVVRVKVEKTVSYEEIAKRVKVLYVNKPTDAFELILSKSEGINVWLDNVPDWYKLLVVTSDLFMYKMDDRASPGLDFISELH